VPDQDDRSHGDRFPKAKSWTMRVRPFATLMHQQAWSEGQLDHLEAERLADPRGDVHAPFAPRLPHLALVLVGLARQVQRLEQAAGLDQFTEARRPPLWSLTLHLRLRPG
jgi:hypothetical protein